VKVQAFIDLFKIHWFLLCSILICAYLNAFLPAFLAGLLELSWETWLVSHVDGYRVSDAASVSSFKTCNNLVEGVGRDGEKELIILHHGPDSLTISG
jgi:hypothetical protein